MLSSIALDQSPSMPGHFRVLSQQATFQQVSLWSACRQRDFSAKCKGRELKMLLMAVLALAHSAPLLKDKTVLWTFCLGVSAGLI